MKEPTDKRTKAYKEWKAQQPTKVKLGLGDAIEKITAATGVKKVVETVLGKDCGCKERKEALNSIKLPLRQKAKRCLTEEQLKEFGEYRKHRDLKSWNRKDVEMLIRLYAHVFAIQYNPKNLCVNCGGSARILFNIDEKLEIVYNSYEG